MRMTRIRVSSDISKLLPPSGARQTVAGGDFTGGLYYVDSTVKYAEEDADGKYYGVALKYEYPLSKRTSVYGGTGWYKAKVDYSADDVYKEEAYQAYLGLTHSF